MRRIGHLENEHQAKTLHDYLYVRGIENEVEQEANGRWAIWIVSEDDITKARAELARYISEPDHPDFQDVDQAARLRERKTRAAEAAATKRMFTRDRIWPGGAQRAYLTMFLIAASVLVSLISQLGKDASVIHWLFISEYRAPAGVPWWLGLVGVRQGQVWRLITPIFIHYGIFHLLFNMLWLRDLGGMMERVLGPLRLAIMIVVIAVLSNVAQYAVSGPLFGGMSGVVYGLLGYVWMKGRYDPGCGLYLHQATVIMMIGWFFLCLTGIVGPVANTVHGVGLAVGVVWGYISAMWRRRR